VTDARRITVHGRVQGVGYRASMAAEARRLGLRGWVRNRADGSVEAVAAGSPAALDTLVAWAHTGPRWASVTRVHTCAADGADAGDGAGFGVRGVA